LKRRLWILWHKRRLVAPHAGAWIETQPTRYMRLETLVAPHAGAWIETQFYWDSQG